MRQKHEHRIVAYSTYGISLSSLGDASGRKKVLGGWYRKEGSFGSGDKRYGDDYGGTRGVDGSEGKRRMMMKMDGGRRKASGLEAPKTGGGWRGSK